MDLAELYPGARVWRWHDTGAQGASVHVLTVVRVNRVTVTVHDDHWPAEHWRIDPAQLEGFHTDEA